MYKYLVLIVFQFDFSTGQYGNSLLANGEAAAGDDDKALQKSLDVANECTANGE
jgi:hypothetical protein